jgi:hypothetical protein
VVMVWLRHTITTLKGIFFRPLQSGCVCRFL